MAEPKTVTITKAEYDALVRDSRRLSYLEAAGVDNWEGYDVALRMAAEDVALRMAAEDKED